MKEANRINIRQRQVDHSKPLHIVRDIREIFKKEDTAGSTWSQTSAHEAKDEYKSVVEQETKRIIGLLDKKKTIIIPGTEKFQKTSAPKSNGFSTNAVTHVQRKFQRSNHYIVYSEKNRLRPRERGYEATMHDLNFLKFEKFFISIEELEKIITELENDVNQGEMIPAERAKNIIKSIVPDRKDHVDKIYKYWITRREVFKKSLLRKFWKDQKFSDKYLGTTFRKREREKMKTRRNRKNELEGMQKLKEIREASDRYLKRIVECMADREVTKKELLLIQQLEFEEEMGMLNNENVGLDQRWQEIKRNINLKKLKEKIERPKPPRPAPTMPEPIAQPTPMPLQEIRPHLPSPIPIITKKQKPKVSEIFLKFRLRYNRANKLVIDRYVQKPNSLCPFDDDFNTQIGKYKKYKEDLAVEDKKESDFDNLYEDFLKGKYSGLTSLTDSEEEMKSFNTQIKNFSSSFKHFLKNKKSHHDVASK